MEPSAAKEVSTPELRIQNLEFRTQNSELLSWLLTALFDGVDPANERFLHDGD
jgi:hypothetical protein